LLSPHRRTRRSPARRGTPSCRRVQARWPGELIDDGDDPRGLDVEDFDAVLMLDRRLLEGGNDDAA
jgi:hypothetical protein